MTSASLLLVILILNPCKGSLSDPLSDLMPEVMRRVKEVQEVLVPVPQDLLTEFMFNVGSYYIPLDAESEVCRNHSSFLFDAFLEQELWALRMVDASSKLNPGLMDGRLIDLGSYRQCLSVTSPGEQFQGQHCVVETRGLLPPELDFLNPQRAALPILRNDIVFSVCVPSSCSARDVRSHMDVALHSVNASAILYETSCSTASPPPLRHSDYAAICTILMIAAAVMASTYYDNFHHTTKAKSELLVSFSLTVNTDTLLSTARSKDSLPCLDGLRVAAMAWVLLGHRLFHQLVLPSRRLKDFSENMAGVAWAPMQEVQLAVEVFFLMSGTLATYNFMKDRKKKKQFSYASFFIRRYRRLTPVLAFTVLMYATVIIRVTDGPIWTRIFGLTQDYCERNWWATLAYVSNYANPYEICVPQTWYLTADFQLHMLSPLLLTALSTSTARGLLLSTIAFTASTSAALAYAYTMQLPATGPFRPDQRRAGDVVPSYVQTQYRAGSFLLGLLLGYLLFQIKHEHRTLTFSKIQLWLGWSLSLLLMTVSVFGITYFLSDDYSYSPWLDSLYHVLHRYALTLAIAWVILTCITGQAGVVNRVLSWRALLPASRLTYGVYLVHYVLQDIQTLRTKGAVTTDTFTVWYLFCADLLLSHVAAAVLYLAVEAPFNNVFNSLFRDESKPSTSVTPVPDMLPSSPSDVPSAVCTSRL